MRAASSRALRPEQVPVDQHAGALHPVQHRHERLLDGLVESLQSRHRLEPRPDRLMQPQRDIGVLGGVFRSAIHLDLIEGKLLGALAGDVLVSESS